MKITIFSDPTKKKKKKTHNFIKHDPKRVDETKRKIKEASERANARQANYQQNAAAVKSPPSSIVLQEAYTRVKRASKRIARDKKEGEEAEEDEEEERRGAGSWLAAGASHA